MQHTETEMFTKLGLELPLLLDYGYEVVGDSEFLLQVASLHNRRHICVCFVDLGWFHWLGMTDIFFMNKSFDSNLKLVS